ncbi:MAG TPA: hypothetical protein VKZ67_04020 [Natronosporangium sp.]|nr:hypothetical protein [Natronosporangium sp.]
MDNRRQPDHTTSPTDSSTYDPSAYWVDGAAGAAGTDSPEPDWNTTGAEPETTEPLALATDARPGARAAGHHQAPGLDDDTPPAGTPTLEPPLWREATRFAPNTRNYGAPTEYVSAFATRGDEPDGYAPRTDGHPEPYPGQDAEAYRGRSDREPHGGRHAPERYYRRHDGEAYRRPDGEWRPSHPDEGARGRGGDGAVGDPPRQSRSAPPNPLGGVSPISPPPVDHHPASPTSAAPAAEPQTADPLGMGPQTADPLGAGLTDAGSPAAESVEAGRSPNDAAEAEAGPASLPQRIPSEPDVPVVSSDSPESGEVDEAGDRWTAPELAWIADQLRRDDVPGDAPSEPLDVDAVLDAVREVAGVQAASVRTGPGGTPTLRLDLADEADPGEVSRAVARLLLERLGLSATPPEPDGSTGWTPPSPRLPMDAETPGPAPATTAPTSGAPAAMAVSASEAPAAAQTSGAPYLRSGTIPPPPPGLSPETSSDRLPAAEAPPEPVSRPIPTQQPGPRVVIDQIRVSTQGLEARVEVQLTAGRRRAVGLAHGPAMDSYLVRLAAVAAAGAIDELLQESEEVSARTEPSRCFVEHTGVVSFGETQVAVAVVLLVCGGWVERLTGSALVDTDPRQAVVRATLGAVNRRLEALLD